MRSYGNIKGQIKGAEHRTEARTPGDIEAHRKYLHSLVDKLVDLHASTAPTEGAKTAKNKTESAIAALRIAQTINQNAIGWAINHLIGLKFGGVDLGDLVPHVRQTLPQERLDKHVWELRGEEFSYKRAGEAGPTGEWPTLMPLREEPRLDIDSILGRWLLGLCSSIVANPVLAESLNHELLQLDLGHATPLFQPRKIKLKGGTWRAWVLRLHALQCFEYWRERGVQRSRVLDAITDAYGLDGNKRHETISSEWLQGSRENYGHNTVRRALMFAAEHGRLDQQHFGWDLNRGRGDYSWEMIAKIGGEYRRLTEKAPRKASAPPQ
jgi:hypothetical protein